MIRFNRFKNGKKHIVTMSYDDASKEDARLVKLFDKYGIKGTFHVNTDGGNFRIQPEDFAEIYKGHEIAVHTVTHPYLENVPVATQISEIMENRKHIENAVGYIARGMSYPYGTYNDDIINTAKTCGIVYSRTVEATNGFCIPRDFMKWHPTCHHRNAADLVDRFIGDLEVPWRTDLFYIWGHSFELKTEEDWNYMDEICKKISGHESVWYATNIEIYDYVMAQKALQISANEDIICNPTAIEVWFEKDGKVYSVKGGETIKI